MAKRKRLSPVSALGITDPAQTSLRAPVADVARDASMQAALEAVSDELTTARREGRLIRDLPLEAIDETYLVRDRIAMEAEDLAALTASLRSRGQQVPIEVVDLGQGRYGLISGWRRLTALRDLFSSTGDARFATIKALVRAPDSAADAYLAMVEENEIRAGLNLYEKARIAARAAEQGAFPTPRLAVKGLYASLSAPKRSKINTMLAVYEALDEDLRFAGALSERMGLHLARVVVDGPEVVTHMRNSLRMAAPQSAAEEQETLTAALEALRAARPPEPPTAPLKRAETPSEPPEPPKVTVTRDAGRLVLEGPGVTAQLERDIRAWLRKSAR